MFIMFVFWGKLHNTQTSNLGKTFIEFLNSNFFTNWHIQSNPIINFPSEILTEKDLT